MNGTIRKIESSRSKELILQYLRWKKSERIDALKVRNEVFGEAFPYEKVKGYLNDLVSDRLVEFIGIGTSTVISYDLIWYHIDSYEFIESAGYVRKVFQDERLNINEMKFTEAHHKDLILSWMRFI